MKQSKKEKKAKATKKTLSKTKIILITAGSIVGIVSIIVAVLTGTWLRILTVLAGVFSEIAFIALAILIVWALSRLKGWKKAIAIAGFVFFVLGGIIGGWTLFASKSSSVNTAAVQKRELGPASELAMSSVNLPRLRFSEKVYLENLPLGSIYGFTGPANTFVYWSGGSGSRPKSIGKISESENFILRKQGGWVKFFGPSGKVNIYVVKSQ